MKSNRKSGGRAQKIPAGIGAYVDLFDCTIESNQLVYSWQIQGASTGIQVQLWARKVDGTEVRHTLTPELFSEESYVDLPPAEYPAAWLCVVDLRGELLAKSQEVVPHAL